MIKESLQPTQSFPQTINAPLIGVISDSLLYSLNHQAGVNHRHGLSQQQQQQLKQQRNEKQRKINRQVCTTGMLNAGRGGTTQKMMRP